MSLNINMFLNKHLIGDILNVPNPLKENVTNRN